MEFIQYSFSEVKKTEEYNSFIIRLILGSVASIFAACGIFYDILHVSLITYLIITFTFFIFTFAIFLDLFRQLVSHKRRYITLFIDISYTSFSILVTAGETQVLWLFYVWLYIGYGSRYGEKYLFVAQKITLFQYTLVLYYSNVWFSNLLDLGTHLLILFALPHYILSLIKRLHLAKSEAIKIAQLKSQFLASMSHEIRTPLNGIIGTSHLLAKTTLDNQQQKYIDALVYSSEILLSLINNILDLSKINANKIELSKNNINIRQCIKKITQTLSFNAYQKELALQYYIHKDVPEILIGDQKRLSQILLNLTGNAIKFTQHGEVNINVSMLQINKINTIKETKNEGHKHCTLLFTIHDTGVGISKEDQKIIFKRFIQVGKESDLNPSGTGLGTTISKELVEIMGGKIKLKSEPGKGSEFSFTLKFDCPTTLDEFANTAKLRVEEPTSKPQNLRILIAEDDDINAMILEQFLLDLGYESTRVTNGLQAIELLHSSKFDVIFMDLHMPKLSGLQATLKIREKNNLIDIIGLTANATTEHKKTCLNAGMNDFLCKPLTPLSLKKAIDRIHQNN
ncbi:MAG: response regulator [Pseudomonadota bacterium]